jgi:hypothetical protein
MKMAADKVFICDASDYLVDEDYDFLNGTLPRAVKNLICVDMVPENIDEFVNLEKISFAADTTEFKIPTDVLKISTITHLFIRGDVEVGEEDLKLVEKMSRLEVLSIDRCADIHSLRVESLRNLRYLEIARSDAKLVNLFELSESLEHLVIRCCSMRTLPEDVYQLWRLKTLDISDTFVSTVSHRILELVNLKYFAWSDYMREVDYLYLDDDQPLPDLFYEMMAVDISSKTFRDYLEEDYGPDRMFEDLEEAASDDYASDEGFESMDDEYEEDRERVVPSAAIIEKPEFHVDYLSRKDARVPDWEFLYDDE